MSRDFLSNQVKVKKIIGKGETNEPSIIIYDESKSTDSVGGIDSELLNNVSSEVFVYFDGAICGKSNNITKSVVTFGGDVEIKGYLYNDRTDSSIWEIDPEFDDCLIPTNILDGDTGLFAIDFNEYSDNNTLIYSQYTMSQRRNAADKYFEFDVEGNVMPRDLADDESKCQVN